MKRVLIGLILGCFGVSANAVVMTYVDEASYLSAISSGGYGLVSEGFTGAAWAASDIGSVASVTSQGVTWTASDGVNTNGGWGPNTIYDHFGDPDSLVGDNGIDTLFGVGGFFSRTRSNIDTVDVFLDDISVASFFPADWPSFGFFGVISTDGFDRFEFANSNGGHWGLRSVSFARGTDAAVPAPATLALFSIGLAGLGWAKRKKA